MIQPNQVDEFEKLISDSLYLDNQAHGIVSRMRDMDSATKSQLRRLYNAVRRAYRAPENERQHQFVMLRARLAYTIARHSLRSLDPLERLLSTPLAAADTVSADPAPPTASSLPAHAIAVHAHRHGRRSGR